MASGHPVDDLGRALPDPSWPAEKAAPEPWDVIRRFCNTSNRESGADRFRTDAGLREWLDDHSISGESPRPDDRARIVGFRELLRSQALAHHDRAEGNGLDDALVQHMDGAELALAVRDGRLDIVPAATDAVDRVISTIALAIMAAQSEDCWERFKACRSCEWVFYDRSKNRSGRWCSMNACGGRAKVAAFREREKDSTR